ncbi:putative DNA polymerase [Campylobacter phage vB_CjeM_WX1]|nr:putative DNA polymerase [Campylobacter phage vB_CjeM_WX1]
MKLFEACFNLGNFETYERFYNTETNKSEIQKVFLKNQVFIEDPKGEYTFLLDPNIKLTKVLANQAKDLETYGKTNIAAEHIRQNYWKLNDSKYNKNISIFYLDIETTAHSPIDTEACRERIVSIQVYHNLTNTNYIFTNEFFDTEAHTKDSKYIFDDRTYDFKLKYYQVEGEHNLLIGLFKLIEALKPLLVLAHNGEGFDFAYLWRRTEKLGLTEGFSPFGRSEFQVNELDNGTKKYSIKAPGVFYMDTIDIYKKFRLKPRESYSLDYIAEVELGERKVNHDCFKTFDGFRTGEGFIRPDSEPSKESILEYKLYNAKDSEEIKRISKEYFIHYSIIDTYLLYRIDNAIKLSDIMISIASIMGIQLPQTLGTTTPWSTFIRNYAMQDKIVLPNPSEFNGDVEFKGGFVAEPLIGRYDWVFSADVTSMYPSQIMAFNLSSETFIPFYKLPNDLQEAINELDLNEDEQYHINNYYKNPEAYKKYTDLLIKYNYCGSLTGSVYDKSKKGILPILTELVFNLRKAAKKEMLKYEQMAEDAKEPELIQKYQALATELDVNQLTFKILINSLYGACGNKHFILYNKEIAKAITGNSRFYINLMSKNINNFLCDLCGSGNYIIYNDTDSVYVQVPNVINNKLPKDPQLATDIIDKFIETKIQPVINSSSQELGSIFNALDASRISAKREAIASSAVFVAKKRYFMKVIDSEGVRFSEPYLKTMGIDIVRSSTPAFSKKYLKKSVNIILESTEEELKEWLKNIRSLYLDQNLMDIAKISSVSSSKYKLGVDKSIPINSRAFLVSNHYINSLNTGEFQPLELGEKVRMLYLREPNPLKSNIFAFNNEKFANVFKDYIDWDTNFNKFFLKPLEIMTGPLNYNLHKETETLEEW